MIPSLCLHDSEKLQTRKLSRFKRNLWLNHLKFFTGSLIEKRTLPIYTILSGMSEIFSRLEQAEWPQFLNDGHVGSQ